VTWVCLRRKHYLGTYQIAAADVQFAPAAAAAAGQDRGWVSDEGCGGPVRPEAAG